MLDKFLQTSRNEHDNVGKKAIVLKEETQADFYSTGQSVGASGETDGRASAGVVRITKKWLEQYHRFPEKFRRLSFSISFVAVDGLRLETIRHNKMLER